jgi:hypothetical protein
MSSIMSSKCRWTDYTYIYHVSIFLYTYPGVQQRHEAVPVRHHRHRRPDRFGGRGEDGEANEGLLYIWSCWCVMMRWVRDRAWGDRSPSPQSTPQLSNASQRKPKKNTPAPTPARPRPGARATAAARPGAATPSSGGHCQCHRCWGVRCAWVRACGVFLFCFLKYIHGVQDSDQGLPIIPHPNKTIQHPPRHCQHQPRPLRHHHVQGDRPLPPRQDVAPLDGAVAGGERGDGPLLGGDDEGIRALCCVVLGLVCDKEGPSRRLESSIARQSTSTH